MISSKLDTALQKNLDELRAGGRDKGPEIIIEKVIRASGDMGPRYLVAGYGNREFIRMNANSYLGITMVEDVIEAEEKLPVNSGQVPEPFGLSAEPTGLISSWKRNWPNFMGVRRPCCSAPPM